MQLQPTRSPFFFLESRGAKKAPTYARYRPAADAGAMLCHWLLPAAALPPCDIIYGIWSILTLLTSHIIQQS